MDLWLNGKIKLDHLLNAETAQQIRDVFQTRDVCADGLWDEIMFEDANLGSYVDEELAQALRILQDNGYEVEDATLQYYGDYEGGYLYEGKEKGFECYDSDDYIIKTAGTGPLLAELASRYPGGLPEPETGFDMVLVERPEDTGLGMAELLFLLRSFPPGGTVFPAEFENPGGGSVAMGYITAKAAEATGYNADGTVSRVVGEILADMERETEGGRYEAGGLKFRIVR